METLEKKNLFKNVRYYLLGNFRFFLYYTNTPLRRLMRKKVREHISLKIALTKEKCYVLGSCEKCSCDVPHVLMTTKPCVCNNIEQFDCSFDNLGHNIKEHVKHMIKKRDIRYE